MAQIVADTTELYNSGSKINSLTKELNEKLNNNFKRIEDVAFITKEWVGSSSERFINLAKEDKLQYYKLKDDLSLYGDYLCDFSESLNECINNIKRSL